MTCDECKRNEATFHSIRNVNGHKTEIHLCDDCRKKHPELDLLNFSGLGDFFSTLTGGGQEMERKKQLICSGCGTSVDDFLRMGYLGCPKCYREFDNILKPIILKTQGKLQHTGKIPNPTGEDALRREYDNLAAQLKRAVEEERYEDAAEIKRALKNLDAERAGLNT